MPGSSGCRRRRTPARTSCRKRSISTSPRARELIGWDDPTRLAAVRRHGGHLGHPLPADQDRRRRADTRDPGVPAHGAWGDAAAADRGRPRRVAAPPSLLALGARLHRRRGVAALVLAVGRRTPPLQLTHRLADRGGAPDWCGGDLADAR